MKDLLQKLLDLEASAAGYNPATSDAKCFQLGYLLGHIDNHASHSMKTLKQDTQDRISYLETNHPL